MEEGEWRGGVCLREGRELSLEDCNECLLVDREVLGVMCIRGRLTEHSYDGTYHRRRSIVLVLSPRLRGRRLALFCCQSGFKSTEVSEITNLETNSSRLHPAVPCVAQSRGSRGVLFL